jgi:hypothetical protein
MCTIQPHSSVTVMQSKAASAQVLPQHVHYNNPIDRLPVPRFIIQQPTPIPESEGQSGRTILQLHVPSHLRKGSPSLYKIASKTFASGSNIPEHIALYGAFTCADKINDFIRFNIEEMAQTTSCGKEVGHEDGLAWGRLYYPDGWNLLQICWRKPDAMEFECMGPNGVEVVAATYAIPLERKSEIDRFRNLR